MILDVLRSLLTLTDHPSGRRLTDADVDYLLKSAQKLPELQAAVRRIEQDQHTIRATLEQLILDSWRNGDG